MLLSYDIKPILVFDGQHLPAKALTELKRREGRQAARQKAMEYLRQGKTEQARSQLRRCVDVTHEHALQLIKECRAINVDCVVAPYEADAQLAYLNRTKIADYVITEDSDLVLFGCSNILFKLDLAGSCLLVEADKLYLAMGCRPERFSFEKFRYMCVLSGCDYLDSLPGIGLSKACKFFMKTEDPDIQRALKKIPFYLNMRQITVTDEYIEGFRKAVATFQHMIVYDPIVRRQVRLADPAETDTAEEFLCNAGTFMEDDGAALNLALGNLNPFSMKKLDDWHPDHRRSLRSPLKRKTKSNGWEPPKSSKHPSIWLASVTEIQTRNSSKYENQQPKIHDRMFKIRPKLPANENVEDEEESENAPRFNEMDLLEMYSRERTPPSTPPPEKKQCIMFPESATAKITKRNPFCKSPEDQLPGQSRLSKQYTSLLQSVSPVKCVRSKFFGEPSKCAEQKGLEIVEIKPNGIMNYTEGNNDDTSSDSCDLHFIDKTPTKEMKDSNERTPVKRLISTFTYEKTKMTSTQKTLSPIQIIDSPIRSPIKPKPIIQMAKRRIGLSKKSVGKTTTAQDINVQSRLSQFGFQKKPILK